MDNIHDAEAEIVQSLVEIKDVQSLSFLFHEVVGIVEIKQQVANF